MKTLETLLAQPLAAALGWALLHFIWQGTLVALLLAGVLRVLQQRSANVRYAVSCAALLLMAVLPLATMLSVNASMPAREASDLPPASAGRTASQPLAIETASAIAPIRKKLAGNPKQFWPSSLSISFEPLLPWAILFWLLGVAFFSIRLGGAWVYTERLKVRGTRQLEEEWRQALQRLCRQLRVTRPVRLLESTFVAVPTVIGWLRPVILLPVGALTGLSPLQLESIIAHELAHIRRHDYLINLSQAVIETLLFYHPAVWWVSRRIGQERELCCDDLAVAVCGDPLTYARALFEMEQLRAARPQLAVAANGGMLMNRIERLVGKRTPPANRFAGWLACLAVLTAVVSAGAGAQILLPASNRTSVNLEPASSSTRAAQASNPAGQINAEQVPGSAQDDRAKAWGLLKQSGGESSAGLFSKPLTQQSSGLFDPNMDLPSVPGLFVDHRPGSANLLNPASNQLMAVNLLKVRIPGQDDLPAQEQITRQYSLSPGARVEVSYILGSVEIEAADGDSAEVQIIRSAKAQADLDRFDRINIEPTPSRLVLRGEDSKSNGIEIRHYVRLRLPKTCQVSLHEINGRVSIKGMSGKIRLNEVNGGALIPQVSGELEMQGVNGKIRLGLTGLVPNGIRLRDVGSVELQVAEDINAELEIGELDAAPLLETPRVNLSRIGEKHFQGRLGAGGPVIRIEDVNGRVTIRNL